MSSIPKHGRVPFSHTLVTITAAVAAALCAALTGCGGSPGHDADARQSRGVDGTTAASATSAPLSTADRAAITKLMRDWTVATVTGEDDKADLSTACRLLSKKAIAALLQEHGNTTDCVVAAYGASSPVGLIYDPETLDQAVDDSPAWRAAITEMNVASVATGPDRALAQLESGDALAVVREAGSWKVDSTEADTSLPQSGARAYDAAKTCLGKAIPGLRPQDITAANGDETPDGGQWTRYRMPETRSGGGDVYWMTAANLKASAEVEAKKIEQQVSTQEFGPDNLPRAIGRLVVMHTDELANGAKFSSTILAAFKRCAVAADHAAVTLPAPTDNSAPADVTPTRTSSGGEEAGQSEPQPDGEVVPVDDEVAMCIGDTIGGTPYRGLDSMVPGEAAKLEVSDSDPAGSALNIHETDWFQFEDAGTTTGELFIYKTPGDAETGESVLNGAIGAGSVVLKRFANAVAVYVGDEEYPGESAATRAGAFEGCIPD